MLRIAFLCLASLATATTARPLGVSADWHRLTVTINPEAGTIAIDDLWRPIRHGPTHQASFLLSPLYSEPVVAPTCNGNLLTVTSLSSTDDSGDRRWTVGFSETCPSNSALTLRITATSKGAAPQLKVDNRGAFAGSGGEIWYPQSAYANRESGELRIAAPLGWTVWATGTPIDKYRTTFRISNPSKLSFAAGDYREMKRSPIDHVRILTRIAGNEASALGAEIERVDRALVRTFGKRASNRFALIEVDFGEQVAGTSEHGAIFTEQQKLSGAFDLPYWAHEIGHQWWGVDISTEPATPARTLLTEGASEYGALAAIRALRGDGAAEKYAATLREKFKSLPASARTRALARFSPSSQYEILDAHRLATSRGALALDCAAENWGRDAFNRALARFARLHRNSMTSWAALEEHLTSERPQLGRLFEAWLHTESDVLPNCDLPVSQSGSSLK